MISEHFVLGENMGTVYHHTGFQTYLLMTIIAYLALCFVAPDIAHQILDNLRELVSIFKV